MGLSIAALWRKLKGATAPAADLSATARDRLADSFMPGYCWIAGRKFPAPSASSLVALSLYRSPFVSMRDNDILNDELPRHVVIALYCIATQRESILAAQSSDNTAPAIWGDAELIGLDYIKAAQDIMLAINARIRGLDLYSDDVQKKTIIRKT